MLIIFVYLFETELLWRTCRSSTAEELNRFFTDLNNSVLSDDGKILTIPSTNEEIPPFEMYVRECWVDIYELIHDGYKKKSSVDFVVTGSPGIGKSVFSFYFMWRCMKDDNFAGFYWEPEKRFVLHYSPLHGIGTVNMSTRRVKHKIPHLVDFQEITSPSYLSSSCRVVFSSPNPDRFKEILKGDHAKGFIQPPWVLREILDAHTRISRYRENVHINVVRSQFNIYGGIPRYVLAQAYKGDSIMSAALSRKAAEIINVLMNLALLMKDDKVSYIILHLYPKNSDDYSFDGGILLPASPWVVEELERRDILRMDAKNTCYMRWRQSPFETSTGWMFETFCFKLLQGQNHYVEQLEPKTRKKIKIPGVTVHRYIRFGRVAMDPASQLTPYELINWTPKPGFLYKLLKSNAESLDAYMITRSAELIILQFTIAKDHPVKVKGLEAILNRFNGKYNSSSLVFVCPEFHRLHKMQNLVLPNGVKCQNIPPVIDKYKLDSIQFVLLLNFPALETGNL